jgi:hypothetical protein
VYHCGLTLVLSAPLPGETLQARPSRERWSTLRRVSVYKNINVPTSINTILDRAAAATESYFYTPVPELQRVLRQVNVPKNIINAPAPCSSPLPSRAHSSVPAQLPSLLCSAPLAPAFAPSLSQRSFRPYISPVVSLRHLKSKTRLSMGCHSLQETTRHENNFVLGNLRSCHSRTRRGPQGHRGGGSAGTRAARAQVSGPGRGRPYSVWASSLLPAHFHRAPHAAPVAGVCDFDAKAMKKRALALKHLATRV